MDKKDLKDHKQLGQEQELFFTNEIAPGAPFWLPRGMIIFKQLEKYIRELTSKNGYQETSTPIMVKTQLFKKSGHWDKFGEGGGHDMYNLNLLEPEERARVLIEIKKIDGEMLKDLVSEPSRHLVKNLPVSDNENVDIDFYYLGKDTDGSDKYYWSTVNYTLKPMNCPESTVIYRFRPRSYRELPLRLSEIGRLHRREQSGEINGLLRVRQLTMDDAHIYCTEEQIFDEISSILDMQNELYQNLGFEVEFKLATRPEKRAGTDEMWDKAEKDLENVLKQKKLKYTMKDQDGAFYGPKIDVQIKDSLGREWQLATTQLDFHMPQAFDLKYIDNNGKEARPVMIHRAILGSFERFTGILIEHLQGIFPIWLAPTQIVILPISQKVSEYAQSIYATLLENGIRVELNEDDKPIGAKIREATLQKAPYMCIIGGQEQEASKKDKKLIVSVRTRAGEDLGSMDLDDLILRAKKEIEKKI